MTAFDEYIKGGNPLLREKYYAWKTAIGLQDVNGLKPSEYLVQTAKQNIDGDITFNVVNDMFAQNSWYFRNALVRANYSNLQKGITETTVYLERFFRSMLLGEEHSFRNWELHIEWKLTYGYDC